VAAAASTCCGSLAGDHRHRGADLRSHEQHGLQPAPRQPSYALPLVSLTTVFVFAWESFRRPAICPVHPVRAAPAGRDRCDTADRREVLAGYLYSRRCTCRRSWVQPCRPACRCPFDSRPGCLSPPSTPPAPGPDSHQGRCCWPGWCLHGLRAAVAARRSPRGPSTRSGGFPRGADPRPGVRLAPADPRRSANHIWSRASAQVLGLGAFTTIRIPRRGRAGRPRQPPRRGHRWHACSPRLGTATHSFLIAYGSTQSSRYHASRSPSSRNPRRVNPGTIGCPRQTPPAPPAPSRSEELTVLSAAERSPAHSLTVGPRDCFRLCLSFVGTEAPYPSSQRNSVSPCATGGSVQKIASLQRLISGCRDVRQSHHSC